MDGGSPFLTILRPVLVRWIGQPEVCAIRMAMELREGGYAVVPQVPTPGMVEASRLALRRRPALRGQYVTEPVKHQMRLADAIRAGQMDVLLELHRAREGGPR